ncbi:hypothetical protein ACU4GD_45530 [Cupriavidus basilensis]
MKLRDPQGQGVLPGGRERSAVGAHERREPVSTHLASIVEERPDLIILTDI